MAQNEADFSNLAPEQLDVLRAKLQELASGTEMVEQQNAPEQVCCHSSHFDNDGWF